MPHTDVQIRQKLRTVLVSVTDISVIVTLLVLAPAHQLSHRSPTSVGKRDTQIGRDPPEPVE
ncbi:hypothetical protein FRAHR75_910021 [Frankia sp. Hr75.2]|nr:hypothetical protein FRAHR75_910021 [Frankia sp. Hr75.2]